MHILIVGAGATGTVFGAALLKAGARVTYFVREHHRARLQDGIRLNHQGLLSVHSEDIRGFGVATTPEEVSGQNIDQVWITTPSDALRGPWLPALIAATGNAGIVAFQPDPEDMQYIRDQGAVHRTLVQGVIQFSAWQSPLPHEPADRTGITALLPPGPCALFDADSPASRTITDYLNRGGLRAATKRGMAAHSARLSALMIPVIAGLEIADWKLGQYAGHPVLAVAIAAAREAVAAEAARSGDTVPLPLKALLNRPVLWTMLHTLPLVPAFNAQAFLEYHFSKVGQQTRQMLHTYVRHGQNAGLGTSALEQLLRELPALA